MNKVFIAKAIEQNFDNVYSTVKTFSTFEKAKEWAEENIKANQEDYPNGKLVRGKDYIYYSAGWVNFEITIEETEVM